MEIEAIPCNELNYFELCKACTWAMCATNSFENVKLVLDVTSVKHTFSWFLVNNIPRAYFDTKLVEWLGVQKENSIEYTNSNTTDTTFIIRAFKSSTFPSSLYVSLYNMSTNIRFAPMCLIIWDREHPECTNQGYAEDRCPNSI
jgi:hypothetical protein